jgi:putative aldouronate transport system permease protein
VNHKLTPAERAGDIFIYTILILVGFITILPFLQMITISLSSANDINSFGLHIIPQHIAYSGYKLLLSYPLIWSGYLNTIVRMVLGTALSVFLTTMGAYALSKKFLPNRRFWTSIIIFTMYFSGGLVPSYILVKGLGLRNTIFALILPGAINAYNMIVTRNFFMGIPESLEESAKIDGANDIYILFKIIIPVSKAVLATITLWYGVSHWNNWFDCLIYMDNEKEYVLQLVIRKLLLEGQQLEEAGQGYSKMVNPENMKMAAVVVATLPILLIYPFFQKHFVKGVMLGSLKG